ncbi:DNA polymerase catalytic subunit [Psittacid alphaherpesvirus 5]|uniref:DNA polymerase n=2 Tax=Herpesvirales TaxID=548681 RepID=A0A5P9JP50_9ALPH|nr:DNA polymerase catalytic subunit [Psittacid alphaherpesvirus 5]QFU14567.1 DNA polymerase catalytic subunit [Psittacid alphaherpesvirus 5]UOO01038.1 DNA polymerase catalytic subunit [Psittacid alphaherpesvirus 5]
MAGSGLETICGGGPNTHTSYYTRVESFTHICPISLLTGQRHGTHIGVSHTKPKFTVNGKIMDLLSPGHGIWPERMKYWSDIPSYPSANLYVPDSKSKFYEFHIYDIAESTETVQSTLSWLKPRFLETLNPSGTVITLMGISACKRRVAVHVYGIRPYFFMKKKDVEKATGITGTDQLAAELLRTLQNSTIRNSMMKSANVCSISVDIVIKRDLYYFDATEEEFFLIRVVNSRFLTYLCENFHPEIMKYEANIDAITRFVVDNGFTSFGWYKFILGTGPIQIRHPSCHSTSSDIEVNCLIDNLQVIDRQDFPDYKLLSFDIECKSGGYNDLTFPLAENVEDIVIQISAVVFSLEHRTKEFEILFSLGTCELPSSTYTETETSFDMTSERVNKEASVIVCECFSELELILCFMTFIKQYSPEMITGYNITGFDWPFLYHRMTEIYGMRVDGYGKFNTRGIFKVQEIPTSGFGKVRKVKINGMITIDMMQIVMEKVKMPSYRLNAVASSILGQGKVDLHYRDLPELFSSGPKERGRIGEYCIHDSRLVTQLFFKFMPHLELSAVANLACIPLSRAIYDGQQIRVLTCLLQRARKHGFVLPSRVNKHTDAVDITDDLCIADSELPKGRVVGYQGAKVLDPDIGFHVDPVMVFDFASLYPSIIQCNNLCYTTLTFNESVISHLREGDDYIKVELQGRSLYFVRKHIRQSLLGDLLTDWLMMRKKIRERIKTVSTDDEKILLDKQQLAIKTVCNSVYGFTGVATGLLPCLEIAATVTFLGRQMLLTTKTYVEQHWQNYESFKKRFPDAFRDAESTGEQAHSVRVIYGDTDSIFVKICGVPIEGLVRVGDIMAAEITKELFQTPVKLECEKTFSRLLMIAKKKYIGTMYGGKMLMKGVDMVRKTNCRYVTKVAQNFVDVLFYDDEVSQTASHISRCDPRMWEYTEIPIGFRKLEKLLKDAHSKISNSEIDVKELVMTAELSRDPSQYTNEKIAHLTVYHKRVARGEQAPQIKERIEYVIVALGQQNSDDPASAISRLKETSLISSRAEDPTWAERHSLKLDTEYYYTNLIRTLSVMFNALFKGDTKTADVVLRSFIPNRFDYHIDTHRCIESCHSIFRSVPPLGRNRS